MNCARLNKAGSQRTAWRRPAKFLEKKVAAIMKVECSDLGWEISEDLCDAMEAMSHEDNKAPLRFMEKFSMTPPTSGIATVIFSEYTR